jgi:predicted amidohydrolase
MSSEGTSPIDYPAAMTDVNPLRAAPATTPASLRVAAIQLCSTDDVDANLAASEAAVAEAVSRGARFVALPENFAFMRKEGLGYPCAQSLDDEIVGAVRSWARQHRIWLLGGTFPEQTADGRVHNTSVLVSPVGEIAAVYRKIHLFDVDLRSQGGQLYQESASIAPGKEVVAADTPFGGIGLSVCYDVRFPELYRQLASRGVRFLTVPSAFAPRTGPDHWDILLRARAIENQCFVVAPAQWGRHSSDRTSHGRSTIIDPWGLPLAVAPDQPCVLVADCDLAGQDRIRAALPCAAHRRL